MKRPSHRVGKPVVLRHIGIGGQRPDGFGVIRGHAPQHRDKLRSGHQSVGIEAIPIYALHNGPRGHIARRVAGRIILAHVGETDLANILQCQRGLRQRFLQNKLRGRLFFRCEGHGDGRYRSQQHYCQGNTASSQQLTPSYVHSFSLFLSLFLLETGFQPSARPLFPVKYLLNDSKSLWVSAWGI